MSEKDLYNELEQFFLNSLSKRLDIGNVIALVHYAMQVVDNSQKWKKMDGAKKKELVLKVVDDLVKDMLEDPKVSSGLTPETKQAILIAVDVAPYVIDGTIEFSKFVLSHINTKSCSKFKCCK